MFRLLCRFASILLLAVWWPAPRVSAADMWPQVRLLDAHAVDGSARVIGTSLPRHYLTTAQPVYVSVLDSKQIRWGIYRPQARFRRNGRSMLALRLIASATRAERGAGFSTLRIVTQHQEVRRGDVVLAAPQAEAVRLMDVATQEMPVQILGTPLGHHYAAQGSWVVLDKGSRDNLLPGREFALYRRGRSVYAENNADLQLPDYRVGRLRVERVYPWLSLARITASTQAIDRSVILRRVPLSITAGGQR